MLIRNTPQASDRQTRSWRDAVGPGKPKSRVRGRRFGPASIGFWLGGGFLGKVGCIVGVCMPYHYPIAVLMSALWWGIYFGCLGASVGFLIARFAERAPAPGFRGVGGGQCRSRKPGRLVTRTDEHTRDGVAEDIQSTLANVSS
jgi:hypothetical protein